MTVDTLDEETTEATGPEPGRSGLRTALLAIITVAVLAIAVAGGFYWGSKNGSSGPSKPSAVDIGFAQDMANHHEQAIEMATYVDQTSTDPEIVNLAYDIESNQTIEQGEMTGWLDTWGLTRVDQHPMLWMGAEHAQHVVNGLMPGMATPAQMTKLMSMPNGKALDIFFLQLMIHHHQGGAPMAQFAEQHATEDYVRTLAGHMLADQDTQTIEMEQMLRQLGGAPLPPPET
jgi:uncharacterized protein (DUF305 family)